MLEKSLHSPASPSSHPDQMKSNIIKAQMDAALKFKKEEPVLSSHSKPSGTPVHSARSLDPSQDSTQTTGVQEKPRSKSSRIRKLTRQYSFNHSDEDDLPPALAAATRDSPPPVSKPSASDVQQLQYPTCIKNNSEEDQTDLAAPGDLLMDFTEATPLIKTVPPHRFSPIQQFPVELTDNMLQCYDFPPSPGKPSSAAPLHVVRASNDPLKSSSLTYVHATRPLTNPGKPSVTLHVIRHLTDPGKSSSVMPLHASRPLTEPGASSSVTPLHAVRYPSDPGKSSVTPLHAVRHMTDPGVSSSVMPLHAIRYLSDPLPPVQHTTSPTDSADNLRRELDREKIMKRLLMTEL